MTILPNFIRSLSGRYDDSWIADFQAMQNKAKQSEAEPRWTKQHKAKHRSANQNKTKRGKAKHSKAAHHKVQQSKAQYINYKRSE